MARRGDVVGWPGWETVRPIGSGNYGSVYEIQRDVFGTVEKAALKVISIPREPGDVAELYNDGYDEESVTNVLDGYLRDIVSEYTMMRRMKDCVNIVSCEDIDHRKRQEGVGWDVYIKMELLTPLTSALPQMVIPDKTVINVAKDICNALVFCDKYRVVHRDIKPQNIMVSEQGQYKLGDFGIAKTIERSMGNTVIGTYRYMAPEVYNNRPYGHRADIYSLGLVLYWLLNEKRLPFLPLPPQKLTAGDDEKSRQRRFGGEPLPPPAHGSPWLQSIVLKACAFDPEERFSSAQEMLETLEEEKTVVGPGADRTKWGTGRATTQVYTKQEQVQSEPGRKGEGKLRTYWTIGIAAGLLALIVSLFFMLRGCGGDPIGEPPETTSEATGQKEEVAPTETDPGYELEMDAQKLALFTGAQVQLTVSGVPEDAELSWGSSDEKVVTVDDTGLVTGVGIGSATVTVRWETPDGPQIATTQVTVDASGITLDQQDIADFYVGQVRTLTAATSPVDQQVTWSSSDEKVVVVSNDGQLTAMGSGVAIVTASFDGYTASCTVTVVQPGVTLDRVHVSLTVGESYGVIATAVPEDAVVVWTSGGSGVATVNGGRITAVAPGTTEVRAEISHMGNVYTAVCQVTVTAKTETVPTDPPQTKPTESPATKPAVEPSVELDKSSLSLVMGQSRTLSATVKSSGTKVSWSSDNTAVASVSSSGKVTAVGYGSATITASITTGGKTYKAICSVTVPNPYEKVAGRYMLYRLDTPEYTYDYRDLCRRGLADPTVTLYSDGTGTYLDVPMVYDLETMILDQEDGDRFSFEIRGQMLIVEETGSGSATYVLEDSDLLNYDSEEDIRATYRYYALKWPGGYADHDDICEAGDEGFRVVLYNDGTAALIQDKYYGDYEMDHSAGEIRDKTGGAIRFSLEGDTLTLYVEDKKNGIVYENIYVEKDSPLWKN